MKQCTMCDNKLQGNQIKYCSGACKSRGHYYSNNTNTYHRQTIKGLERKMELINLLGGKCSNCGYKTNLAALEFNHIDPSKKEFPLDIRHISNNSKDKLLKEVAKCNLLCSNCHREYHYKEMDFNNVLSIIDP